MFSTLCSDQDHAGPAQAHAVAEPGPPALDAGWGVLLPVPSGPFMLAPGQPAVMSTAELGPISRLMHDTVLVSPGGVHHLFWDCLGQTGDLTVPVAPFSSVALASGRSTVPLLALDVEGALRVATRPAGGDFTALAVVPAVRPGGQPIGRGERGLAARAGDARDRSRSERRPGVRAIARRRALAAAGPIN